MVAHDGSGNEQYTQIPNDAYVLSHRDLLGLMGTEGLMATTEEMYAFAMATLVNLKNRSESQDRQIASLKRRVA